jgi:cytidylate kinase
VDSLWHVVQKKYHENKKKNSIDVFTSVIKQAENRDDKDPHHLQCSSVIIRMTETTIQQVGQ